MGACCIIKVLVRRELQFGWSQSQGKQQTYTIHVTNLEYSFAHVVMLHWIMAKVHSGTTFVSDDPEVFLPGALCFGIARRVPFK